MKSRMSAGCRDGGDGGIDFVILIETVPLPLVPSMMNQYQIARTSSKIILDILRYDYYGSALISQTEVEPYILFRLVQESIFEPS